ncbi:MAG: lytic transglycosylase domain-containing protein [Proteobacteria bacterium]|nr:lytic transglycosylase domain-containing protein [Pseudomonadota bacterium]
MVLPLSTVMALALQCGSAAPPTTLAAIARAESGFDPFAIGVNGIHARRLHPSSAADAALVARQLIGAGESVDLGLAQINSRNLAWLGLSVDDAFDPCANLAASARVFAEAYGRAFRAGAAPSTAARTALSYYNTGSPVRGFTNGYVAKVLAAAPQAQADLSAGLRFVADPPPPAPSWEVFAHDARPDDGFVFSPQSTGETP